jgi:hypothetical protein
MDRIGPHPRTGGLHRSPFWGVMHLVGALSTTRTNMVQSCGTANGWQSLPSRFLTDLACLRRKLVVLARNYSLAWILL